MYRSMKIIFSFVLLLGLTSIVSVIAYSNRIAVPYQDNYFSGCSDCHYTSNWDIESDFINAVMDSGDVSDVKYVWNPTVASMDSDNDGFSNGVELCDPEGIWQEGDNNPVGEAYNPDDIDDYPTTDVEDFTLEENIIPDKFVLLGNYPNPFNAQTTLHFYLDDEQANKPINLKVFNCIGELVNVILDNKILGVSGHYEYTWQPEKIASGVYLVMLQTEKYQSGHFIVLEK